MTNADDEVHRLMVQAQMNYMNAESCSSDNLVHFGFGFHEGRASIRSRGVTIECREDGSYWIGTEKFGADKVLIHPTIIETLAGKHLSKGDKVVI